MTTKITDKNISNIANIFVSWQSVIIADGSTGLTAVSGRGYFIDTTGGTITVTLPVNASVGEAIILKDYARSWATNNVNLASALLDGGNVTQTFSTNGQTVTLVYMDNTKGWSLINEDTTSNLFPSIFTSATGGTITTSTDFKIHTFTGDGCFVVSTVGNGAINPSGGPAIVDYLVVAGGGAGGQGKAGNGGGSGGGAGGFREGKSSPVPSYTASPLVAPVGLTVTTTTYPITVGAGGGPGSGCGTPGSNSVFSTITSAGGGGGGGGQFPDDGAPGGSGAGRNLGNSPPTSPPQGNNGGAPTGGAGAGGGGAGEIGASSPSGGNYGTGGRGGAGVTTSISGSPTAYAGGGGGGGYGGGGVSPGPAGPDGGGAGSPCGTGGRGNPVENGTANRGGGGGGNGGGDGSSAAPHGLGGKGIVIIRYKFQ
jgi:hypothetical protein